MNFLVFFFFFQAEDGIRDPLVTGVQTCALPISTRRFARARCNGGTMRASANSRKRSVRSEERRVGKECRSRWSPNHKKKNAANKRDLPSMKAYAAQPVQLAEW